LKKTKNPSETAAAEVVHHPIDAAGFEILRQQGLFSLKITDKDNHL